MRVSSSPVRRRRHKRVLKKVKGHRGARGKLFRSATVELDRALCYAYRDRRNRKRDFRRLWITRINAACRQRGLTYGHFIHGLSQAGVAVNRKMIADLAVRDEAAFNELMTVARAELGS